MVLKNHLSLPAHEGVSKQVPLRRCAPLPPEGEDLMRQIFPLWGKYRRSRGGGLPPHQMIRYRVIGRQRNLIQDAVAIACHGMGGIARDHDIGLGRDP